MDSQFDSPSRSANSALQQIPADVSVLITTADHALLTPAIVRQFLQRSSVMDDATVGIVKQERIAAVFPDAKRTVIRLRDGGFVVVICLPLHLRGALS